MKKKKLFIITLISIIIIFINILLRNELNNKNNPHNIATDTNKDNIAHTYDCEFTVTYKIVSLLDNYIYEVPEYSYIVVDKFQENKPITHYISTKLKNNLEVNKNYEFTYHIKGTSNITSIYNVIHNIDSNNNLDISLSIKETDKLGKYKKKFANKKNTYQDLAYNKLILNKHSSLITTIKLLHFIFQIF